jgi:hypothetical protein
LFGSKSGLKNPVLCASVHAFAVVGDIENNRIFPFVEYKVYFTPTLHRINRILNEILNHPLKKWFIQLDDNALFVNSPGREVVELPAGEVDIDLIRNTRAHVRDRVFNDRNKRCGS